MGNFIMKNAFRVYMGTTFILAVVVMVLVLSGCSAATTAVDLYLLDLGQYT